MKHALSLPPFLLCFSKLSYQKLEYKFNSAGTPQRKHVAAKVLARHNVEQNKNSPLQTGIHGNKRNYTLVRASNYVCFAKGMGLVEKTGLRVFMRYACMIK